MKKPRILLIDDEASVLKVLGDCLAVRGYESVGRRSGIEARRWLAANSADLAILDVLLENEDGLEVLTAIKKSHPDLPVIILTGQAHDPEISHEAGLRGALKTLPKALPADQFLAEVARVVDGVAP